jgi:hypothetical protein
VYPRGVPCARCVPDVVRSFFTDLPGVIGRAVLVTLLPARRPRYSARKVKCATSRYLARPDGRPRAVTSITAIDITLTTPPLDPPTGAALTARTQPPTGPQPPTRRQRVTALMATEPHRSWPGRELAELLQIKPRNLHTQLGEWARLGFTTRTGFATYALNTPAGGTSSTTAPDP